MLRDAYDTRSRNQSNCGLQADHPIIL
jgi:hypothetical protein